VSRRSRIIRLLFLVFGISVALYLGTQGAQEQHVRIVLGSEAPRVVGLDLRYVAGESDVMREVHFTYPPTGAPRIVSHEPKLPNGEYKLQIDVDTREGRRGIQRRVTLGGGSTQVDVSSALVRDESGPEGQ
jgi:hypothetical protein